MGPANIASNPTTEPTAIPAVIPFSFEPVETFRIVSIRKHVSTNSSTKDWRSGPAGRVAPSVLLTGKSKCKSRLASSAPTHWLATYGATSRIVNRRAAQKPSVTAGFKCAPEMSPKV